MKYRKEKICNKCGCPYIAMGSNSKYCGSIIQKTGCAYEAVINFQKARIRIRPKKVWSLDAPKFQSYSGTTKGNYNKVHRWLRVKYGPASMCENKDCSKESRLYQWALINGCKYEKNRDNFLQLCHKCHFAYDTDNRRQKRPQTPPLEVWLQLTMTDRQKNTFKPQN